MCLKFFSTYINNLGTIFMLNYFPFLRSNNARPTTTNYIIKNLYILFFAKNYSVFRSVTASSSAVREVQLPIPFSK
jgi:hypothetical protein